MSDTASADAPPPVEDIAAPKRRGFSLPSNPDTQSFLGIFIVASFVAVIVLVCFHPPPQEQASTVFTLIGGLGTLAAGVGSFYFGSSKSESSKDVAREATVKTLVSNVLKNDGSK